MERHHSGAKWWHVFDRLPPTYPLQDFLRWLTERTPSPVVTPTSTFPALPLPTSPNIAPSILAHPHLTAPFAKLFKIACAAVACSQVRLNQKCPRKMCAGHCVQAGGCIVHKRETVSERSILRAQKRRAQESRELRQVRSLSPAPCPLLPELAQASSSAGADWDQAEVHAAIIASLSSHPENNSQQLLSSTPLPLMSSTLSTDPPQHPALPRSPSAPVERLPPLPKAPAKRPRHTTQMHPAWHEELRRNHIAEAVVASADREVKSRKLAKIRRFTLVFWGQTDKNATFGCKMVHATYYDAHRRWKEAPQALRDEALAAEHSPQGLWSLFASKVPLR